jgi:hypothetical protein
MRKPNLLGSIIQISACDLSKKSDSVQNMICPQGYQIPRNVDAAFAICTQKFYYALAPCMVVLYALVKTAFNIRRRPHVRWLDETINAHELADNEEEYTGLIHGSVKRRKALIVLMSLVALSNIGIFAWQIYNLKDQALMFLFIPISFAVAFAFITGNLLVLNRNVGRNQIISQSSGIRPKTRSLRAMAVLVMCCQFLDLRLQWVDKRAQPSQYQNIYGAVASISISIVIVVMFQMLLNEIRFQRRLLLKVNNTNRRTPLPKNRIAACGRISHSRGSTIP